MRRLAPRQQHLDTQYTLFDIAFFNLLGSSTNKVEKRKAVQKLFNNLVAACVKDSAINPIS